ncbi:unnamed protein product [Tilletia controversa]|nr:hypothetical protein CF336_g9179 [Tilletia laevis]KAE8181416.1 hypothetical protein CF335_g8941 [Tilletia laevis]CAD6888462.1 unnamed protein product [Tilletia caries]CAD6929747.1 unnamed protein product [Tilletia controversa]CAD6956081.1 unnamed protein product [Tilletia controversa]
MFVRPRRLIVVHLKRSISGGFGGGARDTKTFADFGEWFDIHPFATGFEWEVRSEDQCRSIGEEDVASRHWNGGLRDASLYRLQSIVVLDGGHSFGRYVSHRRRLSSVVPHRPRSGVEAE